MDSSNYVAPAPGGGYVTVVGGKVVGTYPTQSAAENAYNSASGPTSSGAATGNTYSTPNGQKTLAQIQSELQAAGWNGNYNDPAAMLAAYNATASGAGASGGSSSVQALLDAIASGNAQDVADAINKFNATQEQQQNQFNADKQLSEQQLYSNLGTNLLDTASKLSGPADYYQFQQMTSGGKDLFNQLFGNQPRADFSAPTGQMQPMTLATLMQDLGFKTAPQAPNLTSGVTVPGGGSLSGGTSVAGSSTNGSTAGQYTTKNGTKTINDMLNELKVANWPQANQNPSNDAIIAAYKSTSGGDVTPLMDTGAHVAGGPGRHILAVLQGGETVLPSPYKGQSTTPSDRFALALAHAAGLPVFDNGGLVSPYLVTTKTKPSGGLVPGPMPVASRGPVTRPTGGNVGGTPPIPSANPKPPTSPKPTGNPPPLGRGPVTGPGGAVSITPAQYQADLIAQQSPFQVNPMMWDALGPVGQGLVLSAVKAAGWDPTEWQRQLDAARPKGNAPNPQNVLYQYWNGGSQAPLPGGVY